MTNKGNKMETDITQQHIITIDGTKVNLSLRDKKQLAELYTTAETRRMELWKKREELQQIVKTMESVMKEIHNEFIDRFPEVRKRRKEWVRDDASGTFVFSVGEYDIHVTPIEKL
jgi:hypothetical protein